MPRSVDDLFPPKPEARLRIYAWQYERPSPLYERLLKVGQTTRPDVNQRIRESQGQAPAPYTLEVDESGERTDGSLVTDAQVRARLRAKGFDNPHREWMRCTPADVRSVIQELVTGSPLELGRSETFGMRPEQADAVRRAYEYFHSVWQEDMHAIPRFLWNAKMRFGKTFATYELAKELGARRVLVVTFKPAVEGAWRDDLLTHVDFEGWQFMSRNSDDDPRQAEKIDAPPPVRRAIGAGTETKTITLTCGKLVTGVTVKQWSAILMLRNLNSPETYFQAAFRVRSPWSITNPEGNDPTAVDVIKSMCFVFDFAPTRALRQIAEYGLGLDPHANNPETAVQELVNFLPVLAYDGSDMKQIDAAGVLDWAMAGTTATMLARRWESALLVNVDNDTLKRILADPRAMEAIMNIEGFRALGSDVTETVINKSEAVKATKKERGEDLTSSETKELSAEEKEYRDKRKQILDKLVKFATRIPAFMYLTDFRENTLKDVITKLEPGLFKTVTGLTVADFNLLVQLGVFNAPLMNQAVFQFRRYEDASLNYTGIESHPGLRRVGLYDTVVVQERSS